MLAYPRAQRVCIMDLLWRTRIDLLPPARLHLWCTGTTTWWGPVRLHGHSFAFLVISLSLAEISLSLSSSSFYPPCNWVYDVSSFYSWQREKKKRGETKTSTERENVCCSSLWMMSFRSVSTRKIPVTIKWETGWVPCVIVFSQQQMKITQKRILNMNGRPTDTSRLKYDRYYSSTVINLIELAAD